MIYLAKKINRFLLQFYYIVKRSIILKQTIIGIFPNLIMGLVIFLYKYFVESINIRINVIFLK